MPDQIHSEAQPHHEAEALLPWYATGQLDGEELRLVEDHVSSCAHCRRQLAFERRMVDEFATLTPEIDAGWERLRQRLEPARAMPPQRARSPRPGAWDRIVRDAAMLWQALCRPPIAALALAQLAFVVLAATVLVSLSQPSYRALGSAPPPQSANAIAIFSPETTESQLSDLLRGSGASLVGGPTPTDAYLLQVPAQSRPEILARLRANRHVLMAEPIDRADS